MTILDLILGRIYMHKKAGLIGFSVPITGFEFDQLKVEVGPMMVGNYVLKKGLDNRPIIYGVYLDVIG